MTDNFIPIVSNTPPPIDDGDDDDDDFGGFTGATTAWDSDDDFDSSYFQSAPPMSDDSVDSPVKKIVSDIAAKKLKENYFTPTEEIASNVYDCDGEVFNVKKKNSLNTCLTISSLNDVEDQPVLNNLSNPVTDWGFNSVETQNHNINDSLHEDTQMGVINNNSHSLEFEKSNYIHSSSPPSPQTEEAVDSVNDSKVYKGNNACLDPILQEIGQEINYELCSMNQNQSMLEKGHDQNNDKKVDDIESSFQAPVSFNSFPTEIVSSCSSSIGDFEENRKFSPQTIGQDAVDPASNEFNAFEKNECFINSESEVSKTMVVAEYSVTKVNVDEGSELNNTSSETVGEAEFQSNDIISVACNDSTDYGEFVTNEEVSMDVYSSSVQLDKEKEMAVSSNSDFFVKKFESNTTDIDENLNINDIKTNSQDSVHQEIPQDDVDDEFSDFADFERDRKIPVPSKVDNFKFGEWSENTDAVEFEPFSDQHSEFAAFANFGNESVPGQDNNGTIDNNASANIVGPVDISSNDETLSTKNISNNLQSTKNDDDFSAFHDSQSSVSQGFANFDDDFSGFESAGTNNTFPQPPSQFSSAAEKKTPLFANKIESLLSWFPLAKDNQQEAGDDDEDKVLNKLNGLLHCHIEKNILPVFHTTSNNNNPGVNVKAASMKRPTELWGLLEDIDNAIALKYQWNSGRHNQKLLSALGIKTKNVLFSGASTPYFVPTYAAGLGLLEPDKEITMPISAADKITATTPTDKTAPTDSSDATWIKESENSIENHACSLGNGIVANSIVPSNVLDSSSLNFDIFDTSASSDNVATSTSSSAQDQLDPELLELAMSASPEVDTSKRVDPLSKILATLGVSSKKKVEEDEEELSEDAANIVKKFPDLSYMRSSVLMFPVGKDMATSKPTQRFGDIS